MPEIRETARAKLNLALHVRARRSDGYHEIETMFAFCEDGDELDFAPAQDLSLEIKGPFAAALSGESDNLVLRAARLLAAKTVGRPGARITLDKRLPVASGLGGGSADAAAVLRGLNRLWDLGLSARQLAEMALELGADVPVCVHSSPMIGGGVGERLEPVSLGLLVGARVLLANPGVAVSTADVFRGWDGIDRGAMPREPEQALLAGRNDLQDPALAIAPAIRETLDQIAATSPRYPPRMSGSGATCFAIYPDRTSSCAAAEALRTNCPRMWLLETQLAPNVPY